MSRKLGRELQSYFHIVAPKVGEIVLPEAIKSAYPGAYIDEPMTCTYYLQLQKAMNASVGLPIYY